MDDGVKEILTVGHEHWKRCTGRMYTQHKRSPPFTRDGLIAVGALSTFTPSLQSLPAPPQLCQKSISESEKPSKTSPPSSPAADTKVAQTRQLPRISSRYGCLDLTKASVVSGESTLTDAMTAAGQTYEEIAHLVAEQVGAGSGFLSLLQKLFISKKRGS